MAGDWIKMRDELWTHPRFLFLSNELLYGDNNVGFLVYVCGEDALEIGVMPPSNKSVTELALRGVTIRALRAVTMTSLMRVWSAVNTHASVEGSDAVCAPMTLWDLDEIAGFDGFGAALTAAGWLEVDAMNNKLIFKNFLEFNEPACLRRKPALSNAERQQRHRERNRAAPPVTKSNESNAREEKRREEEKRKPVEPSPPDGGPVWSECLAVLTEQGFSEKTARSFLGLLCRDYEDREIVEAVKASVGKANATGYIRGILKARPKKGEAEKKRLAI